MKRFMAAAGLASVLTISLANTTQNHVAVNTVTGAAVRIATQSGQVHVQRIKRIPKFSLLRSNPYRLAMIANFPDDDAYVEDDNLITARRRRDFKVEQDEILPERILWRLFLARQLALLKYKEIHG
jgi:hypothetical protein